MHNKHQNVHGGGTALRAVSRKKYAALALCVSLWMAGGSVAGANALYLNADPPSVSNTLYAVEGINGGPVNDIDALESSRGATDITSSGKKLTVTGGDWPSWDIYGGRSQYGLNNLEGYHLTLSGVQNAGNIYGAYTAQGNATNNHVTLNGGSAGGFVYGGYSASKGDANYNTVTIKNGGTAGRVHGGYSVSGNANNNTVTLEDVELGNVVVFGGYVEKDDKVATDNTVSMTDSEVHDVFGANKQSFKDNTLNLSSITKTNTVNNLVKNFATINIENAKWGTPALTFSGGGGIAMNRDGSYADINTDGVVFSGVDALSAGQQTVLIKNIAYGDGDSGWTDGYPDPEHGGKIESGKYKIGTSLEGTGTASVVESGKTYKDASGDTYYLQDLIYTIETGTAREQTHNTVMGAEVGMAALSVGNDFIGAATEGLALAANTGADGIASFAQMGGGAMRQETGSHVDVHTWNAILGLGHKNEKARGTLQYGAFFEYGRGNYTTHAENNLRGDGNAQYTGGGLLAKYTMKNDVYVEGSLRIGTVKDDARDVMSDGAGNPYSYKTSAGYQGFHIGVGKEIALADGNSVDVYGKYFFNHKNGVSFEAGGHYDLDAVTSSVIRLGARYTVKRDKWNFYGGVAYEHELDGKATGTADGVAIRAADTSGGSVRAEIGATMQPDENSPWKLDLNLAGFAGKKQGFTGGVSVGFMF